MSIVARRLATMATTRMRRLPSITKEIEINKRIMECANSYENFSMLMEELQKSPDDLNAINVVTSIYTIAKKNWGVDDSTKWLLDVLGQRTAQIGVRELPNIVWALSHLPPNLRSKVIVDIAAHASVRLRGLSLPALAAVLRGFAHMRFSWDVLWSSASIEVAQRYSELCPLSFSNLLWSFGVVQRPCIASALPMLCLFGVKAAPDMNATDVGSCLWAATRLDIQHRPFVSALLERSGDLAESFDDIGLVRVIQALSYFGENDVAVLSKLSEAAADRFDSMSVQNVQRIADALPRLHCCACLEIASVKRRAEMLASSNSSRNTQINK